MTLRKQKIKKLKWKDFFDAVETIATYVEASSLKFINIYGIPRGGLMLAVMLSHRLKIPFITRGKITKYTLIVDDICDQGDTVKRLVKSMNDYKNFKVIVWIRNNDVIPFLMPVFWVGEKSNNEWVQFPWETPETSKYDYTT